jgi:thiol-disulfide isomerase/thioredoxin
MKKLVFIGIIVMMILVSIAAGCTEEDDKEEEEELENLGAAPNFSLTSIDEEDFSLKDYRGQVVILDFMATWCEPCKTEMGYLKQVYSNYPKSQVQIITIDIDETETDDMLYNFSVKWGDDWIYAIDTDNEAEEDYSVSKIPVIVIIDQQGDIRHKHVGESDYETLSSKIDKLL